jgi:Galactose oxidase, central domain
VGRLIPILVLAVALAACSDAPAASGPGTPGSSRLPSAPSEEAEATPTPPRSRDAQASSPSVQATLSWSRIDAAGPAAREDHTWTVDPHVGVAYLFGGRDGATVLGDLWAFDLDTDEWIALDPANPPPARFGHEATWVDGVGLVVFAGQAGSQFFNDLWAFDPQTESWRLLPAAGEVPVARYGTCAALGPDGRLWISHGFTSDGTRFSDTVAYDFEAAAWSDETPVGSRPVERCLHACWWTDGGELALYAGQTTGTTALGDRWTLGDGGWARLEGVAPPERNLYARARMTGSTLVFGGQALDGGYLDDLWWIIDGEADAVLLEPDGERPPRRAGAELIGVRGQTRLLLFGGRDGDGARDDLWMLTAPRMSGE